MRVTSRLIATAVAVVVWLIAGYAVASGPRAFKVIAPVAFGVNATCSWQARD